MLWGLECLLDATTALHKHPVHEYVYCIQGAGVLESGDRQMRLCSGSSFFVAAGQPHRFLFEADECARVGILCLDVAGAAAFLSPPQLALLGEFQTLSACVAHYLQEREALELLLHFVLSNLPGDASAQQSVCWSAVGLLLAMHGKALQTPVERSWLRYREKILSVRDWLDAHLDQSVSIDALTLQFGLSRSILTREFKRHVGLSVVDYCNLRRVEQAAQILAANSCPVTQAAYEAGFANISHFHRQFKAVFGVTPAGFRHQISGVKLDNMV